MLASLQMFTFATIGLLLNILSFFLTWEFLTINSTLLDTNKKEVGMAIEYLLHNMFIHSFIFSFLKLYG